MAQSSQNFDVLKSGEPKTQLTINNDIRQSNGTKPKDISQESDALRAGDSTQLQDDPDLIIGESGLRKDDKLDEPFRIQNSDAQVALRLMHDVDNTVIPTNTIHVNLSNSQFTVRNLLNFVTWLCSSCQRNELLMSTWYKGIGTDSQDHNTNTQPRLRGNAEGPGCAPINVMTPIANVFLPQGSTIESAPWFATKILTENPNWDGHDENTHWFTMNRNRLAFASFDGGFAITGTEKQTLALQAMDKQYGKSWRSEDVFRTKDGETAYQAWCAKCIDDFPKMCRVGEALSEILVRYVAQRNNHLDTDPWFIRPEDYNRNSEMTAGVGTLRVFFFDDQDLDSKYCRSFINSFPDSLCLTFGFTQHKDVYGFMFWFCSMAMYTGLFGNSSVCLCFPRWRRDIRPVVDITQYGFINNSYVGPGYDFGGLNGWYEDGQGKMNGYHGGHVKTLREYCHWMLGNRSDWSNDEAYTNNMAFLYGYTDLKSYNSGGCFGAFINTDDYQDHIINEQNTWNGVVNAISAVELGGNRRRGVYINTVDRDDGLEYAYYDTLPEFTENNQDKLTAMYALSLMNMVRLHPYYKPDVDLLSRALTFNFSRLNHKIADGINNINDDLRNKDVNRATPYVPNSNKWVRLGYFEGFCDYVDGQTVYIREDAVTMDSKIWWIGKMKVETTDYAVQRCFGDYKTMQFFLDNIEVYAFRRSMVNLGQYIPLPEPTEDNKAGYKVFFVPTYLSAPSDNNEALRQERSGGFQGSMNRCPEHIDADTFVYRDFNPIAQWWPYELFGPLTRLDTDWNKDLKICGILDAVSVSPKTSLYLPQSADAGTIAFNIIRNGKTKREEHDVAVYASPRRVTACHFRPPYYWLADSRAHALEIATGVSVYGGGVNLDFEDGDRRYADYYYPVVQSSNDKFTAMNYSYNHNKLNPEDFM